MPHRGTLAPCPGRDVSPSSCWESACPSPSFRQYSPESGCIAFDGTSCVQTQLASSLNPSCGNTHSCWFRGDPGCCPQPGWQPPFWWHDCFSPPGHRADTGPANCPVALLIKGLQCFFTFLRSILSPGASQLCSSPFGARSVGPRSPCAHGPHRTGPEPKTLCPRAGLVPGGVLGTPVHSALRSPPG